MTSRIKDDVRVIQRGSGAQIKNQLVVPSEDIATAVAAITRVPAKASTPPAKADKKDAPKAKPKRKKDVVDNTVKPAELRQARGLPVKVPQVEIDSRMRTAANHRVMLDLVQDTIMRGLTDEQATRELGIGLPEYRKLQTGVMDRLIEQIQRQTTYQVYAHYVLEQKSCVLELQKMIDGFKTSKQHNAIVGAVKAKSEILDKIISKGQDMGVIEKRAKRIEFIGSLDVRNMTDVDIARSIMLEMQEINELVDEGIIDAKIVEPAKLTGS